jgi:F0F1-type ATP synthase membrane subunit a
VKDFTMMQFRGRFRRVTNTKMRLVKLTLILLVFAGLSLAPLHAAEASGLPPKAGTVFNIGPLPVTNSMLVTWIVAVCLIVFAQYATRRIKDVPDGAQNFWEFLVESLHDFLEEIIGPELIKKSFWFFATILSSFASRTGLDLCREWGRLGAECKRQMDSR